jgi:hypothetical protein
VDSVVILLWKWVEVVVVFLFVDPVCLVLLAGYGNVFVCVVFVFVTLFVVRLVDHAVVFVHHLAAVAVVVAVEFVAFVVLFVAVAFVIFVVVVVFVAVFDAVVEEDVIVAAVVIIAVVAVVDVVADFVIVV